MKIINKTNKIIYIIKPQKICIKINKIIYIIKPQKICIKIMIQIVDNNKKIILINKIIIEKYSNLIKHN